MHIHMDEGYIFRLWDFRNLLLYRSTRAGKSEQMVLVRQALEVDKNIECYLGKTPQDTAELKRLFAQNH